MAKKKEQEPQSEGAIIIEQVSQINQSVQAQGGRNRERHQTVMGALCSIASHIGLTINEENGKVEHVEEKTRTIKFSEDTLLSLAQNISSMISKPAPTQVIKTIVDDSVHYENNDYLMEQLQLRWMKWKRERHRKDKAEMEEFVANQINTSIYTYFDKEVKKKKRSSFRRKAIRLLAKLYGGYVDDKLKHLIAYSTALMGICFGIAMYIGITAYKASFDDEFTEYRNIRPFLVADKDYVTTIENLKELIHREDKKHLRDAYDSVAFENYMRKEWEKRRHHEAEWERKKQSH